MGEGGIPFFLKNIFVTELIETESRSVVARGWGVGEMGDSGQTVQISSYKMNKFWGCNVQHTDCS